MKVLLAGAFGKLGTDVLKTLVDKGHEVVAIDMVVRDIEEIEGKYTKKQIDVTKPDLLKGVCEGINTVVTTVGLTRGGVGVTNYDIDYQGNLNLLNEAKAAGVKNFAYVSVLKADNPLAKNIPMLDSKAMLEKELKASGLTYTIFRPTGYFYDIVKVFKPMIEKGEVTLLGKEPVSCNVIDTPDFAEFIEAHMNDENETYDIGGTETYTYEEIADMMFAVNNKTPVVKHVSPKVFDMIIFINKLKKTGKADIIRFSKWTLTQSMVASIKYGSHSFKKYIEENGKIGE